MGATRTLWLGLLGCLLLAPHLPGECQRGGTPGRGTPWGGGALPSPPLPDSLPLPTGQEVAACAWGWVPFEEGCYGFFSQELSWRRAEVRG